MKTIRCIQSIGSISFMGDVLPTLTEMEAHPFIILWATFASYFREQPSLGAFSFNAFPEHFIQQFVIVQLLLSNVCVSVCVCVWGGYVWKWL